MSEQALGGIPLGFGIVVEDKPSELSCVCVCVCAWVCVCLCVCECQELCFPFDLESPQSKICMYET